MADWKQITARIRRARTGKDPATQLANLYQKTRDAMVAFELAKFFETAGLSAEAAKWYSTAAERFRRADWKSKAQEAAARLGGMLPAEGTAASIDTLLSAPLVSAPEPGLPFEQTATALEAIVAPPTEAPAPPPSERLSARRRGRRGGRNRRKTRSPSEASVSARVPSAGTIPSQQPPPPVDDVPEPRFSRVSESLAAPRLPAEPVSEPGAASPRGRYGDPGLSSRLSLLEMQFRRLLTCAPLNLGESDRAPVGPGVFLLSDSDLTTNYYVEACQTLRIAIGNLSRGSASRRGAESIKPRLADHLGIAESRVTKYLADHCVVRFLQLDEGASHFAHFVVAVLRPALNE